MENVNDIAMFTTAEFEWIPIASAIFAFVVGSLIYNVFKRRWHREDQYEANAAKALTAELSGIKLQVEAERAERQADGIRIAHEYREQYRELIDRISDTREELSHLCGQLDRERPKYGKNKGQD